MFPTVLFLYNFFLYFLYQPYCVLTDSNRCGCVCGCLCADRNIQQPKPESYRCSTVPNKLPQLTPRCHQCELERRWICSIPQHCYFDRRVLYMFSGDQQGDWQERQKQESKTEVNKDIFNTFVFLFTPSQRVLCLNCSDRSGVEFLINVRRGAKYRLSYALPWSLANNMETKVDTV